MASKEELLKKIQELENQIEELQSKEDKPKKKIQKLKRNQDYLDTLVHSLPDIVWLKDTNGKYLFCNSRFEDLTGINEENILGKTDYNFMKRELADKFRYYDTMVVEREEPVHFEEEFVFASDGHREILETIKTPVHNSKKELTGILSIGRDITHLIQTEKERLETMFFFESLDKINRAIQTSTELSSMVDNVLEAVLNVFKCDRAFLHNPLDPDADSFSTQMERTSPEFPGISAQKDAVKISREFCEILLSSPGPVELRESPDFDEHDIHQNKFQIKSMLAIAVYPKTGKPWEFGIHHCSRRHDWRPNEKRLFREIGMRITNGLDALLIFQKLQENQIFLNSIIDNIPSMLIVKEPRNLRHVFVNKAAEKAFGRTSEELQGKTVFEFEQESKAHTITEQEREALRCKQIIRMPEEMAKTNTSEIRYWDISNIPVFNKAGDPSHLLIMANDISEQKKAQKELRKTKERLQLFMDSATDAIAIFNSTLKLVDINSAFLSFIDKTTKEELLGIFASEFEKYMIENNFVENIAQTLNTGIPLTFENTLILEKKKYQLIIKIFKVGSDVGVIASDISETTRLQEQLQQSQKMESIGRLAGGVAHDFNNMLGIILGNTELARKEPEITPKLATFLNETMEATLKSAELTRQLLTFARKQTSQPKVLNPNKTIEGMLKMLGTIIGENIELFWTPQEDLWNILLDPSQLDQIIANLCVNARDAIKDYGKISIRTSNETVDTSYSHFFPDSHPGEYVHITISDTGSGMDKETQKNIFEPFFTTKKEGKGTGLGLATVYGIVKQNGGFISVYSEKCQGSTFNIYLPRSLSVTRQTGIDEDDTKIPRGDETLFVVEDESPILTMISIVLEDLGYTVFTSSNPTEALKIAKNLDQNIDLLITDVIMPGMNGRVLAENILSLYPATGILFMSGYTDEIITDQDIMTDSIYFIQKPFSNAALAQKVREILDTKNKSKEALCLLN